MRDFLFNVFNLPTSFLDHSIIQNYGGKTPFLLSAKMDYAFP